MDTGIAETTGAMTMAVQGLHRMFSTLIPAGGFLCLFLCFYQHWALQRGPARAPKGRRVFLYGWKRISFVFSTVGGELPLFIGFFPLSLAFFSAFVYRHSYIG